MRKISAMAAMVLVGSLWVSGAVAQDCFKPVAPTLINKDTALPEQRNAMTLRIDGFIRQMNVYLACLERSDAEARVEVQRLIDAWEAPDAAVEVVLD